jgi:hypothetical protein
VGPGGQRRGVGRQERVGSMAAAAATRDRQHSAARFGFKPIQTESKLFQTDSKFSKLWQIQKVLSPTAKIGNKIWLKRAWDGGQLCLKTFPQILNGFWTKNHRISMSWISIEIYWEFLELWISMNIFQKAHCYTLLSGKINF